MSILTLALALVALHGPDGQTIWVNPREVVSARAPTSELLHKDIKCSLQTSDGRLINVVDACDDVYRLLEEER